MAIRDWVESPKIAHLGTRIAFEEPTKCTMWFGLSAAVNECWLKCLTYPLPLARKVGGGGGLRPWVA